MENAIKYDGKKLDVFGKFQIIDDEEKKFSIKDLSTMAFRFAELSEKSGETDSNQKLVDILMYIYMLQNKFDDFVESMKDSEKTFADNKTVLPYTEKADNSTDKNPGANTVLESNIEGKPTVAVIDFHNGTPEDAMFLYQKAQQDGLRCIVPKSSYDVFLSKLDKKQKKKWKKIKGQLDIV